MIDRSLHSALAEYLSEFPAVALLGPRQVGKTTLAQKVVGEKETIYLDLESPGDQMKLADPEYFLSLHEDKLVVLDEIQRVPELFQSLRGLIDRGIKNGRKVGRFLLLGSASNELLQQSSESLAGRIAYLELAPLGVTEIKMREENDLWVRGGFPRSFLSESDSASMRWRRQFIRTYLERDIPQLGSRIPAETLRRFWTMLAHRQGALLNAADLSRSLGVNRKTADSYLDLFVDLLLVRRLEPWHENVGKRLRKSPKVYVRDSGLVHFLLGITSFDELLAHPVVGGSWEGFVIENILNVVPEDTQAVFFRTAAGAEIDLVLTFASGEKWAVEVKRSTAPKLGRGFTIGFEDVKADRGFVVTPGEDGYEKRERIEVISLRAMCELVATK